MTIKMTSKTILLSSIVAIAVIAVGIAPIYAITPNFSYGEDTTNGVGAHGCNGGTWCKSDWDTTGINYLYSKADGEWYGADGPNQGWVRTNWTTNPTTTYSPGEHTTSVTTVEYQADIDFNGSITYGTGSLVDHEIGPELWLKSGSNWNKVSSCLFLIEGGDDYSQTFIQDCTYNSGIGTSKDFRIGTTQKTSAYSASFGPVTIADFWNGSYYSEIDEMEICDNPCS